MKLVVGLGNPGPRYANSRHNAGFRVLDRFAAAHAIELSTARFGGRYGEGSVAGSVVGLLQPHSFMNRSGEAVAKALEALPIASPESDLLVVYDDMDLPVGRIRLRKRGGPGGQNGMGDVIEQLGTRAVARIRFGIGRPASGQDPIQYVLDDFGPGELGAIESALDAAAEAVAAFVRDGMEAAMNEHNPSRDLDPGEVCP